MAPIHTILCPIDFSDYSRRALDYALALANWYGASVSIVHVVPLVMPTLPSEEAVFYPAIALTDRDLDQFRTEADAFVQKQAGRHLDIRIVQDIPADAIVATASTVAADLIVMGTHGRTGFERFVLGSVTERVLHKAPCPVLTVPRLAGDTNPAQPVAIRRVLCAVDFSPSSFRALDFGASLAAVTGATLTALHVVEHQAVLEPAFAGGGVPEGRPATTAGLTMLSDALKAHARECPEPVELVTSGKAYVEILRVAEHERADLIAIGVHGGLSGTLGFGSTTNKVVRQATCPVVSLRV